MASTPRAVQVALVFNHVCLFCLHRHSRLTAERTNPQAVLIATGIGSEQGFLITVASSCQPTRTVAPPMVTMLARIAHKFKAVGSPSLAETAMVPSVTAKQQTYETVKCSRGVGMSPISYNPTTFF